MMHERTYGRTTNPPRPTLDETLWRVRANETPLGPRWSDWYYDVVRAMSPTVFTDTDLNVHREDGFFVGDGEPYALQSCECCDVNRATWAVGIGGGWLVVCDACRQFAIDDPEQDITADDYVRIPDAASEICTACKHEMGTDTGGTVYCPSASDCECLHYDN